MLTRGHLLGEIIDEFAAISGQVKIRARLNLLDLNVYAEQYFCEILNVLLGTALASLNDDRSNEPGLDLGDKAQKIAFQVTSTATAQKANKTLHQITPEQGEAYKDIYLLIIGGKQSSYALDDALATKYKFTEKHIWDLETLARKALSLDIDKLYQLHKIARKSIKLKVELEIPNIDGTFPTTDYDKWEGMPIAKVGTGEAFLQAYSATGGVTLDEDDERDVKDAIKKLGRRLSRLPRVTREFLASLYERREKHGSKRQRDRDVILIPTIERVYGGDWRGELDLLEHADLISIDADEVHEYGPSEVVLRISRDDNFRFGFIEFVTQKKIGFRKPIGLADLSDF